MMGDADIVREQLRHLGPERGATGEAALDALVAERDEQRIMREHADVEAQTAREQRHVAEAERDAAKANWDSMDAARLRAEANANVAGRIALEADEKEIQAELADRVFVADRGGHTMSHSQHPSIREHGLAPSSVCERCAWIGQHPFENLDDGNLRNLVDRTKAWMRDKEYSRSDSELAAMQVMETTLRRIDHLRRIEEDRT